MTDKDNIGKRLRKIRLDMGLTKKQMAERLGANIKTYEKWEYQTRQPLSITRSVVLKFITREEAKK